MGCDIHLWAEVKNSASGLWEKVGAIFDDPYFSRDRPVGEYNQPKTDRPYHGRNYDLFAILANVRNGYGFAGCDTGDGFDPISEPRGLPANVSPEIKAESDEWDCDGHSHSYLTLAEIRAFDWEHQKTIHRGWVTADGFKAWKETGNPDKWCGGVTGMNVKHVSVPEMDALLAAGTPSSSTYTQVSWGETYASSAGKRWAKAIETLGTLGSPEDVRVVFWFDN